MAAKPSAGCGRTVTVSDRRSGAAAVRIAIWTSPPRGCGRPAGEVSSEASLRVASVGVERALLANAALPSNPAPPDEHVGEQARDRKEDQREQPRERGRGPSPLEQDDRGDDHDIGDGKQLDEPSQLP